MMGSQHVFQVSLNLGPFAFCQAVHDCVAYGAVAAQGVVPQDTVFAGAQPLYGTLRGDVEVVGSPSNQRRAQFVEGMEQQQPLGDRNYVDALPAFYTTGDNTHQPPP